MHTAGPYALRAAGAQQGAFQVSCHCCAVLLWGQQPKHTLCPACCCLALWLPAESDGHCRTPGSHSGRSSPAEQSFTGGRQRMLRQLAAAGSGARSRRTSLDLLRPAAPGSARRGLDQRFSSAAAAGAVPSCSGEWSAWHWSASPVYQ
jgi:hypothetical protein